MSKIIGIDLGTSNSCVSVFENGKAVVIPNAEGKNTTPSIVGFTKDGERKVGDAAKRQAITNPKNTVYEIKRFIGQDYKDVKDTADMVTYNVVEENGQSRVDIDGKKYTPQEISAMVLQKMKQTAEAYLGTSVDKAVITVPAYFNDSQRKATKEAGEIAGLEVVRVINEPTAAALAYGLDKTDKEQKILVFDFGGGTHDVSILDLSDGVFETLATSGDTNLGGGLIDETIMKYIIDGFKSENGVDISSDAMAMQRVKEAAEKAKIELSASTTTEINLPYLFPVDNVPKHYVSTLTRAKFEQMISPIVERTIAPVKTALESANLGINDINEIILVGGSTRIPCVQKAVSDYFGGRELNKSVNPDEVVAAGASVQGAVLGGDDSVNGDILLLDVTPLNLGIETLGGVMTTMIDANTTIPCKKTETYAPSQDMQTACTIHVLQGNRTKASDCKSLGMFNIEITPGRKEEVKVEVTFDIDANGILKVTATDVATGKNRDITISGDSGLSTEEIERMKAEAEANAEADKKFKEEVDKLNSISSYGYSIKNTLEEENFKNALTDEQKKTITDKIAEIDEAVKSHDVEKAETLQKEINEIMEPIMKEIYEKQEAEQAAQQAANESANASDAEATSETKTGEAKAEDVPFEEVK